MARLPDIRLEDWLQDQQKRFQEATAGLFPALEFQLGTRVAESEIPTDYPTPGGMDQWQEAERQQIEDESRRAQQESDERRRQEEEERQRQIQEQADQYRQQQMQAQQAQQAEQDARERSVMDTIKSLGIPTPGEAFSSLGSLMASSGDHTSTTGALDATPVAEPTPPSDVDRFNQFSSGMLNETFGEPTPEEPTPPDNESSTGLLDQLGSAASSAYQTAVRGGMPNVPEIARRGLEGSDYLIENYGIGHILNNRQRLRELGEEVREGQSPVSAREFIQPTITPDWEAQNPEKAEEYRRLQDEQTLTVGGMVGIGGGGMQRQAIDAIKSLVRAGLDDAALAAERGLAEKTTMTLDDIQKLTRGIQTPRAAAVPEAASATEEPTVRLYRGESANPPPDALNPASGNIFTDTPENARWYANREPSGEAHIIAVDVPQSVADRARRVPFGTEEPEWHLPSEWLNQATRVDEPGLGRGFTAEEARQMNLPGFEDVVRMPGRSIRGFGAVPESMSESVESIIREGNEALSAERRPFTAAERTQTVADMLNADPQAVAPVLAQAQNINPKLAGINQEMLKQNTRSVGDAWDNVRIAFNEAQQNVKDFMDAHPGVKPEAVPEDLTNELAYRATQLQNVMNDLNIAIRGQSLSAGAASQVMNAQKGGRLGAYAVSEAQQIQALGESTRKAAAGAQRARNGIVDAETEEALREVGNKLGSKRTRRSITGGTKLEEELGAYEGATGAGGGGSTPRRAATAARPGPEGETLAETLGRLKREQGRLEMANAPDTELGRVASEIDDVLNQMNQEAHEIAIKRMEARGQRVAPTLQEQEKIINEAIGRRTQSKIRSEAMAEARGFRDPEVERIKLTADTEKALQRALDRHVQDTEKLQQSIDQQVQRRVDGMLAQEQRAQTRTEVREMAKQAQVWANRIRKFPDQRPQLQEELDQILGQMSEHSNVGERVANDLRERLEVNLSEDLFRRTSNEERAASRALTDAQIRGIQQQIQDVLASPKQAPGRAARVAELYDDLQKVSEFSFQKATDIRRRAHEAKIMKSGLFAQEADKRHLVEMFASINPNDPKTLRPILESMVRPSLWQVWRELSFINMLSDPMTHAKNITSTISNGLMQTALRDPLAFIGSLGQTKGQVAGLTGGFEAIPEGFRLAAQTMKSGYNPRRLENALAGGEYAHIGRESVPQMQAETFGSAGRFVGLREPFEKAGGAMGKLLHAVSTRPLEAADAMMGHIMYSSTISKLAQQHADDLLREGKDLSWMRMPGNTAPLRQQAAGYILDNIWDYPDLIKQAGKIEDYTLFRSKSPDKFESALRQLMGLKEVGPDAGWREKLFAGFLDFIMPFYNVPYNFTKQGLGNVIGAPVEGAAMLGSMAKGDRKAQGEHFAKAVQGGLMMGLPVLAAMNDNLTANGPEDPGDRRVWLRDHKPNSWRLYKGAPWISYEGTPWAIPFATVAGAAEELRYNQKADPNLSPEGQAYALGTGAFKGAVKGAMSQSLVDAAARNFEQITGQGAGPNVLAQTGAGIISRYSPHALIAPVPSGLLNFLATVSDTVERDAGKARNIDEVKGAALSRIEQRLPGLRQELPVRRDAFGEEIPNQRSPLVSGAAGLFPGYQGRGTGEGDPITEQLERGSVGIPDAPKEIPSGKGVIPLTIREQQEFQALYGQAFRSLLEKYGAGTRSMTDEDLTWIRDQARKDAVYRIQQTMSPEEMDRRWTRKPAPIEVAP